MDKNIVQRLKAEKTRPEEIEFITLGYLIHDVARLLKRRFEEAARQHGITLPQWRVIRQLIVEGERTQASLANLIDSDPMTVSRMVERMEASGLVSRRPDPNDSRAKLVKVTPDAEELARRMRLLSVEVFENALENVSAGERKTLVCLLNRINENLDLPAEAKESVA